MLQNQKRIKPRETVAELQQRMQQAKKAAANKEAEDEIQIFVPTAKPTPKDDVTADHVINDSSSCSVVSSSGISLDGLENQQSSQRKQWEINEVAA